MSLTTCRHADVHEFDGLRSCLACGEARFSTPPRQPALEELPHQPNVQKNSNNICILI